MTALLLGSLLAVLPECPHWINEATEVVAPLGVQVDNSQKIKNKLRCYHTVILPWAERCAPEAKSACKELANQWLDRNFTVLQSIPQTCPGHNRKTFMLNVRTSL